MKVEGILKSKGRSVEVVQPWVTVAEAVRRLVGPPQIGALVVCADAERRVAGIINERNIVRALAKYGTQVLDMQVADVMSQHIPVCSPEDSIAYLMLEMTRSRNRHLPVVEHGKLSGVVSIGDVVKHRLAEMELETGVLRDLYNAGR
ncbi:MAG: CBS domain-containing protein [Pseudonocardiaceae bacterium]